MNSTLDTRHSSTSPTPIIHVVDDDKSFRTALTRLLRASGYEARGYASAAEFLGADPGAAPGCVLLDLRMPGLNGFDLQQSLTSTDEPLPIIFLTGHGDIPASVRAIKAGAVDFLTKPVRREALLGAVQNALERDGQERKSRALMRELRSRYESLTAREREVFILVVAGKLNKQTAAELGTVERTIKVHRGRIMDKMRAESLAELVRIAVQLGLAPKQQSATDS